MILLLFALAASPASLFYDTRGEGIFVAMSIRIALTNCFASFRRKTKNSRRFIGSVDGNNPELIVSTRER
jgi:hypothetical protein